MDAVNKFTPCSVPVYGWSDSGPLILVMPQYEGSLDSYIYDRSNVLEFTEVVSILQQVCEAMVACEGLCIAHNDLKPQNVLVTHSSGQLRCFLTDFGCAEIFKDRGIIKHALLKGVAGLTVRFAPPEALEEFIGEKSIISYGCKQSRRIFICCSCLRSFVSDCGMAKYDRSSNITE